jgi:hypothetical protein
MRGGKNPAGLFIAVEKAASILIAVKTAVKLNKNTAYLM